MARWSVYYKGQKYNHITLLQDIGSFNYQGKNKCRLWRCSCDCGKQFNASTRQIKNGLKTCGCSHYRKFHEYPAQINYKKDQRFNQFVIIERNLTKKYTSWNCGCDCGKDFITSTRSIQRGRVSCGCSSKRHRLKPIYQDEEANLRLAIKQYKAAAIGRGLCFSLSFEDCKTIFYSNCHYCLQNPCRVLTRTERRTPIMINGIDRKNNDLGYFLENVVPCCSVCNRAKSDMSYEDFKTWISRLINASHTNENYEPVNKPIRVEL